MICVRSWSIARARGYIDPTGPFGLFDHLARILHHLLGDPDEFAVFG